MAISQSEVERLFNAGEFSELLRVSQFGPASARGIDSRTRILLTHALALTGQLATAKELALLDTTVASTTAIRSRAALILGLVNQAEGNVVLAAQQFQTAVRLANDSADPERIAWALLFLFRQLIDGHPTQNVATLLPEVRRAVTKAGVPHATAYLHSCVSVLEGQTGRFDEAVRHCDVAQSILQSAPNAWLSGTNILNRACVAYLMCEFEAAAEYTKLAKQALAKSGHARGALVLDNNLGHLETLIGRFDRARNSFGRVLGSPTASSFAIVGALEGIARMHLAANELDQCEFALQRIDDEATRHDGLWATYHTRWAAITKARLFLKRLDPAKALEILGNLQSNKGALSDLPLAAASHLVGAQACALIGHMAGAAQHLVTAAESDVTSFPELQPQHYYASGLVTRSSGNRLSDVLERRAIRLWAHQGVVSTKSQMDVGTEESKGENRQRIRTDASESVANSLAAAIDLAYSPKLLAAELIVAVEALGCSADVRVVEAREHGLQPQQASDELLLVLGTEDRKTHSLVCRRPVDPLKAILLADVLRIGRAAVALERARQEERSRAALWPASPAEEQAGALYLAEEMQTLFSTARRIAPTGVPVLITGETGTGKEVLARMIHAYSARAEKTFLPFNCSATPKDMLDSQLFGHRRGSFTGASENFSGIIRAAAGGTLFLDEIGETTLDTQPKLLRFLESSEVLPIGEVHPVRVDVRIIAATNADLDTLLANGRFREDLYYRLNIVRLHVPPLRERRVEIPALAHHYLHKHAQECGKGDLRLAEETMEYLVLYRWPGNVRQLANEMRRLAALAEPGAVLMPEHLSAEIAASRRTIPASQRMLDSTELVVRLDQPMAAAVQHLERALVQYALTQCNGHMEDTAAMLGLSRKGLYLKRQRFGLEPPGARAVEVA
jgi:DNA-binding NtrC family response regulator